MSLVVDAGFVVAALTDGGPAGLWAEDLLAGIDLAAPHWTAEGSNPPIPSRGGWRGRRCGRERR